MTKQRSREKSYGTKDVIKKLRRLADALERERPFAIQIAGKRIKIPVNATVEFEHEREGASEEVEIEIRWKRTGH